MEVARAGKPWNFGGLGSFLEQWSTKKPQEKRWAFYGPAMVSWQQAGNVRQDWLPLQNVEWSYTTGKTEKTDYIKGQIGVDSAGNQRVEMGAGRSSVGSAQCYHRSYIMRVFLCIRVWRLCYNMHRGWAHGVGSCTGESHGGAPGGPPHMADESHGGALREVGAYYGRRNAMSDGCSQHLGTSCIGTKTVLGRIG